MQLAFDLDITALANCGFNVVDPTCFFEFQRKFYLAVSCSNRDWFYGQTFASLLFELEFEPHGQDLPLASLLQRQLSGRQKQGSSIPSVHFFRAAELRIANGIRSRNFEVLSRAGKDEPGHVIFGPNIDLKRGPYQVRLQYAARAAASEKIGDLDVCSCAGSNVLGKKGIFGTNGQLVVSAVDVQIPQDAEGIGFETGVASNGASDLRLTDVAVTRL